MATTPPTNLPLQFDRKTPAFSPDAFANGIKDHGLALFHYRAIPCPVGMTNQYDTTHKALAPGHNCSNGFIYEKAGTFTCLFSSNATSYSIIEPGVLTGSSVMLTMPLVYDTIDHCPEETVTVAVGDRLYLVDPHGWVVHHQRITRGDEPQDYLAFPPVFVQSIYDSNGIKYAPHDYRIVNGNLQWVGNAPSPGMVYAIRYLYQPYFYIERILHEVRLAQTVDRISGVRQVQRMPYSVIARRENVGRNEYQDDNGNPIINRQVLPPTQYDFNGLSPTLPYASNNSPVLSRAAPPTQAQVNNALIPGQLLPLDSHTLALWWLIESDPNIAIDQTGNYTLTNVYGTTQATDPLIPGTPYSKLFLDTSTPGSTLYTPDSQSYPASVAAMQGEWTMEAWVRFDAIDSSPGTAWDIIQFFGNNNYGAGGSNSMGTVAISPYNKRLTGGWQYGSGTNIQFTATSGALTLGRPAYIAARKVSDGSGLYHLDFFVNDLQVYTGGTPSHNTDDTGTPSNLATWEIGIGGAGAIQSARVSNIARTNQELLQSYRMGAI